ncbi:pantoate--beta-alanine ligase [Acidibrevibacterium fodinaquatile]|uniref:4-phosphopantoate--beta-alanine ligase n=1 Tax=Acidibrevibacterium fodinaquatile TaxID=1969806 RepID=UPI0030B7FFCB
MNRRAKSGADLVYAPAISAMYPSGYATTVSVAGLSEGLCGAQRPGHFDGMATVVTKLFLQAGAESAWFGEKDYQQWLVVRRLVADLDIPVRLRAVPTVREADGLALSSRNRFLSPGERAIAPLLAEGHAVLTAARFKVEYLEIRDAETLAPCTTCHAPARVLAAVRLGSVRLIDNWPIPTAAQRA